MQFSGLLVSFYRTLKKFLLTVRILAHTLQKILNNLYLLSQTFLAISNSRIESGSGCRKKSMIFV
tara:strand:+ start:1655 stop:1849 length:195 start_codon:yes stop_codon:yes gene_type:complete